MPVAVPDGFYGQIFVNDTNDLDGWSEGHYLKSVGGIAGVMDNLRQIWRARKQLLSQEYRAVLLRVSNTNLKGDSLVSVADNTTKAPGFWNNVSSSSAAGLPNNVAVYIRLQNIGTNARSVRPLRGVPSNAVNLSTGGTDGQRAVISAAYEAKLEEYLFVLSSASFILARTGTPPAPSLVPIDRQGYNAVLRYRKTGRPFGLLRGRSVPR